MHKNALFLLQNYKIRLALRNSPPDPIASSIWELCLQTPTTPHWEILATPLPSSVYFIGLFHFSKLSLLLGVAADLFFFPVGEVDLFDWTVTEILLTRWDDAVTTT